MENDRFRVFQRIFIALQAIKTNQAVHFIAYSQLL